MIDNCASGGRRIDMETLRRSIPLWRSDYQCPADFPTVGSQCHHHSFNTWLPWSGTTAGRDYDSYRMRSAYSPAMSTNYTFSQRNSFGDDPEKLAWLKHYMEEYLQVRPYLDGDLYPLTQLTDRTDTWCASQFHKPEESKGLLQVFRREDAPYETARLKLFGLDATTVYRFRDEDTGAVTTHLGAVLMTDGIPVTMESPRSAKLFFYEAASR